MIAPIQLEEVEQYNSGLGKMLKWLQTAITTRRQEITRRKALAKKAREERAECIRQEEDRVQRRKDYLAESAQQHKDDYAEEWEIYNKWEEKQRKKDAGETVDEDEDDEDAEPPQKPPPFDEKTTLDEFDQKEENAVITIPPEADLEYDDDWVLTEEQEYNFVHDYLEKNNLL